MSGIPRSGRLRPFRGVTPNSDQIEAAHQEFYNGRQAHSKGQFIPNSNSEINAFLTFAADSSNSSEYQDHFISSSDLTGVQIPENLFCNFYQNGDYQKIFWLGVGSFVIVNDQEFPKKEILLIDPWPTYLPGPISFEGEEAKRRLLQDYNIDEGRINEILHNHDVYISVLRDFRREVNHNRYTQAQFDTLVYLLSVCFTFYIEEEDGNTPESLRNEGCQRIQDLASFFGPKNARVPSETLTQKVSHKRWSYWTL